ncbi:MAG: QseB, partial [uncultured bacterium]
MRVLLVEDDELLGDGICSGLKHYGHTVDWVKDGKAAYDALSQSQESFDAVILDLA